MTKSDNSKTILIIVTVIVGILLLGGIIVGASGYWLYKIGSAPKTAAPTATNIPTPNWRAYNNARYGFEIKYPSTFSPTESQNGDGVTLTSSSPAITVRVYAANNSASQTLDEYLNFVRENLFKENEGAEELEAKDTSLSAIAAQKRKWQYKNSLDGSKTILEQVTALKDGKFYSVEIVIGTADYSQYQSTFDEILSSYKIK